MSISDDLRDTYKRRFEALYQEAQAILSSATVIRGRTVRNTWLEQDREVPAHREIDGVRAMTWFTQAANLLHLVLLPDSPHRALVQQFATARPSAAVLDAAMAKFAALKDEYEQGLLGDPWAMVRAEVAADYLEQSELLLAEGYHIAAAVLAGAVLEDALRRLCDKRSIPLCLANGKPKTIDPLNTELAKAGVYNAPKAAEIRGWAALRNAAAHGKPQEVDATAVQRMVAGVRSFVAEHLR